MGLQSRDFINVALDAADLVVSVGYDLVEYAPSFWNHDRSTRIIHIDFEPAEIDSHYGPLRSTSRPTSPTPCGRSTKRSTAASTARDACRSSTSGERGKLRDAIRDDLAREKDDGGFPMKPQKILWDAREYLGPDDIVLSDVGAHKMWIARYYQCETANTCLISNGFCSMGFAPPGERWARSWPTRSARCSPSRGMPGS